MMIKSLTKTFFKNKRSQKLILCKMFYKNNQNIKQLKYVKKGRINLNFKKLTSKVY